MTDGRIPRFKVRLPPRASTPGLPGAVSRPAPADRGLDERWRRLSIAYRRQNPFCRFCVQEGNDAVLADVVDHIKPRREYPQLTHVWKNLEGLCRLHDGLKARMENYARETKQLEQLPFWCEAIENRPKAVMTIPPELWVRSA
jgi:hypothetical protein